MKNEDLYVYKKSDFYEDFISSQKEYYEREQVDTLLAEKDREIAELYKKLMPCINGDCILTCEVVEKYGKENAELKAKLDEYVLVKLSIQQMLQNLIDCGLIKEWYFNGKFNIVLTADDPHLQIAQLKQKLEDVQASAYADSVDAGMRERRLRRALYKTCANWAHFAVAFFSSYTTKEKWYRMELKCLKKAEEYR